jgi:pyridoxine kinase
MDVDAINAVDFSNHTGYPKFTGTVLDGAGLTQLIDGLEINGLLNYTHLLTGYIGSLSLLETIAGVVDRLRKINPNLIFGKKKNKPPFSPSNTRLSVLFTLYFAVCDPVQGDDGRLYCKPELPHAFRSTVLPIASIITPNQFEAELLAEMPIKTEKDALTACGILHSKGPHTVVITSLNLDPSWVTIIASTSTSSTTKDHQQQQQQTEKEETVYNQYKLRVPRVDGYFTGTGDLFTALLLGWTYRSPENLKFALEHAVAGLQTVLLDTVEYASQNGGGPEQKERTARVCAARELRLIQNQDALAAPGEIIYKAIPCDEAWPV